ncbi:MAG: GAF domain-containing protein [Bacteroidota bacterium]
MTPDKAISSTRITEIESFYDLYAPVINGAIKEIISDPSTSDEVLSRIFYNLSEELQNYQHKDNLILWLLNLARRECVLQLIQDNDGHKSAPVNPYVNSLPVLSKTVFALVYFKGLTVEEVASLLHVRTDVIDNIFHGLPHFTPYMFPNVKRHRFPTSDILQSLIQNLRPDNDVERVAALKKLEILYTPPEDAFDKLTETVAKVFDTPMAFLSLVDNDVVFYKSQVGPFGRSQVYRKNSLCSLAILSREPLVIEDASLQDCFKDNPFVHGRDGIIFYAGAPLITKDGFLIGALCIVDSRHKTFTFKDTLLLTEFAEMAMLEIESRHDTYQQALFYEQVASANATLR